MTVPTLKVEVALASDPLDLTPTYTDLTAYVKQAAGVTISRGRDSEFTSDSSGSATFTLLNDTRRFDPLYSAGPYYGTLTPGRAVRISDSVSGEVLFTGFVVGWPQSFESGGVGGLCVVRCTDALGYLSAAKCNNDPYYDYLADTVGSIGAFFRYPDGATWINTEDHALNAVRQTGAAIASAALGAGLKSAALTCTATGFSGSLAAGGGGTETTFSVWVQTTTKGSSSSVWQLLTSSVDGGGSCSVGIDNAGKVRSIAVDIIPLSHSTVDGHTDVADGKPHHIVVTVDAAGISRLYIDGRLDATGATAAPGAFVAQYVLGGDPAHDRFTGAAQDMSFSSVAMTAAQVQTLYGLGLGFVEESSVTRLTRLADDTGWPATWRDFTTNPHATVGAINYAGQAITEAMQEVERSEQGRLFASKVNYLTFHGRYAVQETTRCNTTQATLSDDPAAGKAYYRTFGYRIDDRDVQNDITVRTPTGEGHAEDATSIATYGRQSTTIDTVLATPTAAQQMADGLLYQRKDVQTRTPPIEIPLGVCDATAQADLLGLELNDRISVEITPQGIGSQVVLPQQVERIEWTITADEWLMRISGSPVKPTFFMLGTSTLGTDRLGY